MSSVVVLFDIRLIVMQLLDSHDRIVAHYNLKPPTKPAYTTSGNVLTISDGYSHLGVGTWSITYCDCAHLLTCAVVAEILASLKIGRAHV